MNAVSTEVDLTDAENDNEEEEAEIKRVILEPKVSKYLNTGTAVVVKNGLQ